ncbi:Transcription factor gsfR2 [Colletotrichum viniferum]|nr:Transcription factor gsfR2 [Colletotrichum viniferum]
MRPRPTLVLAVFAAENRLRLSKSAFRQIEVIGSTPYSAELWITSAGKRPDSRRCDPCSRHSGRLEMQDAQACCALYAAKNQYNAAMILRTIQARAHEVLAAPPPKGRLEALARLHAILLYQIIRIFDGDIPMRASAQQSLTALEPAMLALLPFVKWESSQPTTGPAEDQSFCPTKESWQEWIWQESARRTIFFTCFFLITHQMLIGREPPNGCSDRYIFCQSWTMSAHLWGAPNVVDFAIAWREKKHFVINKQSFNEALRDASADDVDLFGRMLMVGALGIDDTRVWFYNRGGKL